MGVAPSHLGLLSPLCRSRRLRGGATLTSEREVPLSQGRTVLCATRPKTPAQLIRATSSVEVAIAVDVLNRMLELGRPSYVRIA